MSCKIYPVVRTYPLCNDYRVFVNGKEADPGLPVRPMAGETLEIKVILTADQKDGGYE